MRVSFLAALALALAGPPAQAAPEAQAPVARTAAGAGSSPEQQQHYQLVVQKCGRCHSLARAIEHRYSAGEWRTTVRRMTRMSGAAISDAQSEEITEFLVSTTSPAPAP